MLEDNANLVHFDELLRQLAYFPLYFIEIDILTFIYSPVS